MMIDVVYVPKNFLVFIFKKSFKFFRYIPMLSFSKNKIVFKKSFLFFDDDESRVSPKT
jgi:hypothetical protein